MKFLTNQSNLSYGIGNFNIHNFTCKPIVNYSFRLFDKCENRLTLPRKAL